MTSPDFRPYVDLTIYDKTSATLYTEAADYAATALPEFSPRVGTVEDALLQGISYVGGEVIAAINRLPSGLMEGLLGLFGFTRNEATYATMAVTFTAVDNAGVTIPAGTQVGYFESTSTGTVLHTFSTTTDATITVGSTVSSPIIVQAVSTGAVPSLVAGEDLTILTQSSRLLSADVSVAPIQGSASETDLEYFTRGATFLASLSQGVVTASQITNRVLALLSGIATPDTNFTDVVTSTGWRCSVYDLTALQNPSPTTISRTGSTVTATLPSGHGITTGDVILVQTPDDTGFDFEGFFTVLTDSSTQITWSDSGTAWSVTPTNSHIYNLTQSLDIAGTDVGGSVTIVVCDEHGDPLNPSDETVVIDDIEDRSVSGLNVKIMPAMIADISCSIDVAIKTGYSSLEVLQAVEAYIQDLVSPANWDWSTGVKANLIAARVALIAGVDYVDSVTFDSPTGVLATLNAPDIDFNYKGVLPQLTVTVAAI